MSELPDQEKSRALKEFYAAKKAKLDYDERAAKLIPVEMAGQILSEAHRAVMQQLLSMEMELSEQVAAEDDPAACRKLIGAAVSRAISVLPKNITDAVSSAVEETSTEAA